MNQTTTIKDRKGDNLSYFGCTWKCQQNQSKIIKKKFFYFCIIVNILCYIKLIYFIYPTNIPLYLFTFTMYLFIYIYLFIFTMYLFIFINIFIYIY